MAHALLTTMSQDFRHQSMAPRRQLIALLVHTCAHRDRRYKERSLSADTHPGLAGDVVRDELLHAKPTASMTRLSGREKQQAVVSARKFRIRARLPQ